MPMHVLLSDAGNPDFGQDPSRSLSGRRARRVKVKDFAEASKVCTDYIKEHELGGGNWTGGQIEQDGKKVAAVSYNGAVWAIPQRMNDKPIWSPEQPAAKQPDPMDAFEWEKATINIEGYGEISVTGCFRNGVIQTIPGKFNVNGERAEFIQGVELTREGVSKLRLFNYHPDGVWEKSELTSEDLLARLQVALETWHAGDGAAMILRNELLDRRRALFVEERNIRTAEAAIEKQRGEAAEIRGTIEQLEAEIQAAGPAPGL